jgi:hypothetical protein
VAGGGLSGDGQGLIGHACGLAAQQAKKYVSIIDIFFRKEDAARKMSIAPRKGATSRQETMP